MHNDRHSTSSDHDDAEMGLAFGVAAVFASAREYTVSARDKQDARHNVSEVRVATSACTRPISPRFHHTIRAIRGDVRHHRTLMRR
jgi:hypothetical protein